MSYGPTSVSSITSTSTFYHQSLTPPVPVTSVSTFYETTPNLQLMDNKSTEYSPGIGYCDLSQTNNNIQMPSDLNSKNLTPSSFTPISGESNTLNNNSQLQMTADRQQQLQHAVTSGPTSPPIPECSGCMCLIQDRYYLLVMERAWHLNCLCCFDCKQSLDSQQSCFAKDGIIFCKDDYFKRFPRKCHGCNQEITPNELIMRARNSVFHMHCFKCLVCEKQLNTGDEYGIGKDNVSIFCRQHYSNFHVEQQQQSTFENYDQPNLNNSNTNGGQYSTDFNRPYCPVDNTTSNNSFPPSMYPDPYLQNHTGYNSYLCNLPPTPGISPPNSQSFHSHHHHQQQQQNLSLNSLTSPNSIAQSAATPNSNLITPKEVKGRAKKRKASSNDSPATQSNKKTVNGKSKQSNQTIVNSAAISGGNSGPTKSTAEMSTSSGNKLISSSPMQSGIGLNTSGLVGSVDSPDDYNNKHFDSNLDYFSDEDDDDLLDTSSNGANEATGTACHSLLNSTQSGYYDSVAAVAAAAAAAQRQKRMRTSFKHHQLRVMKSYFELNHNPDAKDLKQLSQKTGLSKRVLQVWFQNARAKFRRGQGGPDCPQGQHSPNPNVSMNIGSAGNLNNVTQGASSTSSISSNSSSLSSSSSTSSDSSLQMLKQQQLNNNGTGNGSNLIQTNSIHHLNMENIDESSNNDSGFSNLNNYSLLNNSQNGGGGGSQNNYALNSVGSQQGHIPQHIHSQPSYQHHMLQQQ